MDQHVLVFINAFFLRDGKKEVFGELAVRNTPREGHAEIQTVVMAILLAMSSTVLSQMAERTPTR
jgi:hypothetical protein